MCYEVEHMHDPTYYNYQKRDLRNKSVKLELRQRIYSSKTYDYKIVYLPFIIEITQEMKWKDLLYQADLYLSKLKV